MTASLNLARKHATCRSCKASVVWAVSSTTGNEMPVNYNPDPVKGNVQLAMSGDQLVAGVLSKAQAAGARAAGTELRTSHFATCPNAETWRRQR